jgi:hypothetical protein
MPETHEKSFSNNYAAARPRQSGRFPDGYTDFLGDNSFSLRPGEERFVAYELAAANRRPTRRRWAGMVWTPKGFFRLRARRETIRQSAVPGKAVTIVSGEIVM